MNLLKTTTLLVAVSCIVLLNAGQASAVTTLEPDYRGDENSVYAVFNWVSFDQDAWKTTLFETGPSIYPLHSIDPFAFDDGLDTTIMLPNFIDELPMKKMRIQMFFDGPVSGDLLAINLAAYDREPTQWQIVDGSGPILSNAHWFDIEIFPNPDWEEIIIFGNQGGNLLPGNLLTIEVDTVSIPEPATMTLLAIGGLAMLRRRKK